MKNVELKEAKRYEDEGYCIGEIVDYIILANDTQVGEITILELENGYTHCDSILVYESYRNQGLGTEALEILAEMYGCYTITPNNEDAQRLYERLGSEDLSNPEAYYTDQGYGVYEIS